jgi:hypothetical protein
MRLVVGALVAVALTGARPASATNATALPDCLGKLKVEPSALVLACGDGNFGLKRLHWIGWGEASAAATGIAYANDCNPYCAAGRFHDYRAVIVVDGRQRCGAVTAYRRVTVAFVGPTPYPKASVSDLVYNFRCR